MAAAVRCDAISDGLRDSECLVSVDDVSGRRHQIRVERDFLVNHKDGAKYLPIGVVAKYGPHGLSGEQVLVEFSGSPETLSNRMWVKKDQLIGMAE